MGTDPGKPRVAARRRHTLVIRMMQAPGCSSKCYDRCTDPDRSDGGIMVQNSKDDNSFSKQGEGTSIMRMQEWCAKDIVAFWSKTWYQTHIWVLLASWSIHRSNLYVRALVKVDGGKDLGPLAHEGHQKLCGCCQRCCWKNLLQEHSINPKRIILSYYKKILEVAVFYSIPTNLYLFLCIHVHLVGVQ